MVELLREYLPLTVGSIVLLGALDYWLTVLGLRWHQRYRRAVIDYERYEQNPLWHRAIHQTRRYDYRHGLAMGLLAGGTWWLLASAPEPMDFETTFFVSLILLTYAQIIAGHLSSMRRARYIGLSPHEVQGKLWYSYRATLRLGLLSEQMDCVPLLVLCLLLPHPVTLAAAASPLLLATLRALWLRLYNLRSGGRQPHPLRIIWEYLMAACHAIIVIGGSRWLWMRLS